MQTFCEGPLLRILSIYGLIADRLHENIDYKIYSQDRDFVDYNEEYLSALNRFFTSKTQDEQQEFDDIIRDMKSLREEYKSLYQEKHPIHQHTNRALDLSQKRFTLETKYADFFCSDNPLIHRECEELHEFVARDFLPYFQTKEIIKDLIIKNRYPQYENDQRGKAISINKLQ